LQEGNGNVFYIEVTAENDSTKTYTITVTRQPANGDPENPDAPLTLTAFSIENGAPMAVLNPAILTFGFTGVPTHYRAAESETALSSAAWKDYNSAASYTFSNTAYGVKTVYAQLKNAAGSSAIMHDDIVYKAAHAKQPLKPTSAYPNPTAMQLNVAVGDDLSEDSDDSGNEDDNAVMEVTVYGLTGTAYSRQTLRGKAFTVDLSRCPSGLLLVKIARGDKSVIKPIVKY
jgi:hypothetical protein